MKKSYAKSLKEYDPAFELDANKLLATMKRYKGARKKDTSGDLDETKAGSTNNRKNEYDFKKLKKRPGLLKTSTEAAKARVSIRLDGGVLSKLRTESERLGIPYQTLIGSVLHRYISGELIDRASPELRKLLNNISSF